MLHIMHRPLAAKSVPDMSTAELLKHLEGDTTRNKTQ